jgi:hypothetical protein
MTVEIFSLQGQFYTAVRNTVTGKPGALTNIGNVSKADITLTPTISDKYESFTGNRLLYGRLMKEKKGELAMTVDEFKTENLLLALFAASVGTIAGATATAEVLPTVTVGQSVRLNFGFATSITTVVDSAGSPITLVAGTDYTSLGSTLTFLTVTGTQPYKATYVYAAASAIAMLSAASPPERYVVFDGVDTNTGYKCTVDIPRVQFTPAKQMSLIDPDWGSFDLTGAVLYDPVNAPIANFGGFARIQYTDPVV